MRFQITIYDNNSLDAKIVNVVFTAIWVRLNNTHTFGHCVIFWAIPKSVSTAMIIFLCPRNHEPLARDRETAEERKNPRDNRPTVQADHPGLSGVRDLIPHHCTNVLILLNTK